MTLLKIIDGVSVLYATPKDNRLGLGNFFVVQPLDSDEPAVYEEGSTGWLHWFNRLFLGGDVEVEVSPEVLRRTRTGSQHLLSQEERNTLIDLERLYPVGTVMTHKEEYGAPSPVISPFTVTADDGLSRIYKPLSVRMRHQHDSVTEE